MPSFTTSSPKHVETWPDTERPLPSIVREYIERGAPEGTRNDSIFKVAQQFFAGRYSSAEAESFILPVALGQGGPKVEREVREVIASAFKSSKVTEPISTAGTTSASTLKRELESDFLRALKAAFEANETIAIVDSYRREDDEWKPGKAEIKTRREWERWHAKLGDIGKLVGGTPGGAFIAINPLRAGSSSRSNDNVAVFRHVLAEFDGPDDGSGKPEQRQRIEASGLPVSVLLDSGKRSIHAWVRVDAKTREEWDARRDVVFKELGCDLKNKDLARVSRCPGAVRVIEGEGRVQKLLAVKVGAKDWYEWEQRNAWTPESWGVHDLVERGPEPPPEVIKGLLRRSCVMQISSGPKMRKSFLLLDLALSVATGKPWLGMETVAGPVVYVDAENQAALIRSRLPSVADGKKVDLQALNDRVRFLPLRWKLRGKSLPEIVQGVIRSIRAMKEPPVLAILEPLYLLLRGAKEKEAEEVTLALEELDELCNAVGCASVFVHHFSKGSQSGKASMDRGSGSGALSRFPDAILTLTPPDAPTKKGEAAPDWAAMVEMDKRWFAPAPAFPVWWRDFHYTAEATTSYSVSRHRPDSYAGKYGEILSTMPPLKRHHDDPQKCEVTAWLASRIKLELRETWNVFKGLSQSEYSFVTSLGEGRWCGASFEADDFDEDRPF